MSNTFYWLTNFRNLFICPRMIGSRAWHTLCSANKQHRFYHQTAGWRDGRGRAPNKSSPPTDWDNYLQIISVISLMFNSRWTQLLSICPILNGTSIDIINHVEPAAERSTATPTSTYSETKINLSIAMQRLKTVYRGDPECSPQCINTQFLWRNEE